MPANTPSDYGALLRAHAELERKLAAQHRDAPTMTKITAIGTLIVALANAPAIVGLVSPKAPAATKDDVTAIIKKIDGARERLDALERYNRERERADAQWRDVVGSALKRQGYAVRGVDGTTQWAPTSTRTYRAAEPDGTDVAVTFPEAP